MGAIRSSVPDDLRVLLCIAFQAELAPNRIAALRRGLVESPACCSGFDLTGRFDFAAEMAFESPAALDEWLNRTREELDGDAVDIDVSIICRHHEPADEAASADLLVPVAGGYRRLLLAAIERVTAERDYVRIHAEGATWLLHSTLQALAERLPGERFIRIHRSTLVRRDTIEQLVRRGRRWQVCCRDGSCLLISRTHLRDTLAAFDADRRSGNDVHRRGGSSGDAALRPAEEPVRLAS
ncbi:LytTR family transcriptional regulator [Sphingomonas ginkgonis]|uniref:LytTR family transcriptional regulator n=1 Tax=Sphingomonas ginkgonis TaxID=2315330 RepID=A0A3R9WNY2_9SPHN|nr:LytTR family DNA-binding domain-containing protein [Sphingomonas ginkgonis]RST29920.1 LytTR family transcriptional regulator [Sphingomonas ginkgonis]